MEVIKVEPIIYQFAEPYNLQLTFECGQCFRFSTKDGGKSYLGPFKDRILKLTQINPYTVSVESNKLTNLKSLVDEFLGVNLDYHQMIESIQIDPLMKQVATTCDGLRIIKQDPLECTVSFILSQCSNIPRITQNIEALSQKCGQLQKFEESQYFLFPTLKKLQNTSEEELRDLKMGYRAKYLASLFGSYPDLLAQPHCSGHELNKGLCDLYGIGQKVADCIQLFAFADF